MHGFKLLQYVAVSVILPASVCTFGPCCVTASYICNKQEKTKAKSENVTKLLFFYHVEMSDLIYSLLARQCH